MWSRDQGLINLIHKYADILVQDFLQHSRLYWWDGNVRIYSNNMQLPITITPQHPPPPPSHQSNLDRCMII